MEGYLRVLSTYSGHIALDPDTRERLFCGISDLIDGYYGGRIVKGYLTTLYLWPTGVAPRPDTGVDHP